MGYGGVTRRYAMESHSGADPPRRHYLNVFTAVQAG